MSDEPKNPPVFSDTFPIMVSGMIKNHRDELRPVRSPAEAVGVLMMQHHKLTGYLMTMQAEPDNPAARFKAFQYLVSTAVQVQHISESLRFTAAEGFSLGEVAFHLPD